jgi:hypothetical protein
MIETFEGTVTISPGTSVSSHLKIADVHQAAIWIPAGWTAANLVVQLTKLAAPATAPAVDAEWSTVADPFGEVSMAAVGGYVISLPTYLLMSSAQWMRLISGTTAARVNQVAQRDILIVGRRY